MESHLSPSRSKPFFPEEGKEQILEGTSTIRFSQNEMKNWKPVIKWQEEWDLSFFEREEY